MLEFLRPRGSAASLRIDRRRAPSPCSGMSEPPQAYAHLPDGNRPLRRSRRLPLPGGAGAPPLQRSDDPSDLRLQEPPGVENCRLHRRDLPLDGVGHRADDPRPRWEAAGGAGVERVRGELRRDERNRKMLLILGGIDNPRQPDGWWLDRRSVFLHQFEEIEICGV